MKWRFWQSWDKKQAILFKMNLFIVHKAVLQLCLLQSADWSYLLRRYNEEIQVSFTDKAANRIHNHKRKQLLQLSNHQQQTLHIHLHIQSLSHGVSRERKKKSYNICTLCIYITNCMHTNRIKLSNTLLSTSPYQPELYTINRNDFLWYTGSNRTHCKHYALCSYKSDSTLQWNPSYHQL